MQLIVEVEGTDRPGTVPGDGAALVAFMSFAVSRGFGAQHPLLALAERLQQAHRGALGPLTTFYERDADDGEDEEKLGLAWQPAGRLREACEALATTVESDPVAATFARRAGATGLAEQARAVGAIAGRAAEAGARVRLTYRL